MSAFNKQIFCSICLMVRSNSASSASSTRPHTARTAGIHARWMKYVLAVGCYGHSVSRRICNSETRQPTRQLFVQQ